MKMEPTEKDSRLRQGTDYSAQSDSGAKPGSILSAWSLVIGAISLALILGGLLAI
jgi:hypothetical protein